VVVQVVLIEVKTEVDRVLEKASEMTGGKKCEECV